MIERYTAVLNPLKVGISVSFIVRITLKGQTDRDLGAFEQAVCRVPEVTECYLTTGESDYVLRVVARSAADFERLHSKVLTKLTGRRARRLELRAAAGGQAGGSASRLGAIRRGAVSSIQAAAGDRIAGQFVDRLAGNRPVIGEPGAQVHHLAAFAAERPPRKILFQAISRLQVGQV